MDLRRVARKENWRFGKADNATGSVEWYVAPAGAKVFTDWTPFRSHDWWDRYPPLPTFGADPFTLGTYLKGKAPSAAYRGNVRCGKAEWWKDGLPSPLPPNPVRDQDGVPECCTTDKFGAFAIAIKCKVNWVARPNRCWAYNVAVVQGHSKVVATGFAPQEPGHILVFSLAFFFTGQNVPSVQTGPNLVHLGQASTSIGNGRLVVNDYAYVNNAVTAGVQFQIDRTVFWSLSVVRLEGVVFSLPLRRAELTGVWNPVGLGISGACQGSNGCIISAFLSAWPFGAFVPQWQGDSPWSQVNHAVNSSMEIAAYVGDGENASEVRLARTSWIVLSQYSWGCVGTTIEAGNIGVAGLAAAHFVGNWLGAGALGAAADLAADFRGAAQADADFTIAGAADALLIGAGLVPGQASFEGNSAAAFTGSGAIAGAFSTAGSSSASFTGAAGGAGPFSVAGSSPASFSGAAKTAAALSITGASSASFVGSSTSGIALVQHKENFSGGDSVGLSWTSATTTGNLLVVQVACCSAITQGLFGVGVTPPAGWSTAIDGSIGGVWVFYKPNASSQSATGNFAVNDINPADFTLCLLGVEVSGIKTSGSFDKSNTSSGLGTSASTGSTGTLSQASEFVLAALSNAAPAGGDDGTFSGLTAGFTSLGQGNDGFQQSLAAYRIVSATTAQSASASIPGIQVWVGAITSWKGL